MTERAVKTPRRPGRQEWYGWDPVAVVCLAAAALAGAVTAVALGAVETWPLVMAVAGAVGGAMVALHGLLWEKGKRDGGDGSALLVFPLLGLIVFYVPSMALWFAFQYVFRWG